LRAAAGVAASQLRGGNADAAVMQMNLGTAQHFADHYFTPAAGLAETVTAGAHGLRDIADEAFGI
jgi:hypothetical protein